MLGERGKKPGIEVERIESPDKTSGYRIRVNNSREGEIRTARYRRVEGQDTMKRLCSRIELLVARARARFLYRTSSLRSSARIYRGEIEREEETERFSVPG